MSKLYDRVKSRLNKLNVYGVTKKSIEDYAVSKGFNLDEPEESNLLECVENFSNKMVHQPKDEGLVQVIEQPKKLTKQAKFDIVVSELENNGIVMNEEGVINVINFVSNRNKKGKHTYETYKLAVSQYFDSLIIDRQESNEDFQNFLADKALETVQKINEIDKESANILKDFGDSLKSKFDELNNQEDESLKRIQDRIAEIEASWIHK